MSAVKIGQDEARELVEHIHILINRFMIAQYKISDIFKNLNKQEIRLLNFLGAKKTTIMREIANNLSVGSGAATGIVDRLVDKKFVRRIGNETDRRIVIIELTHKGKKVYELGFENYLNLTRGILESLDRKEQIQLVSLFRKISRKLETRETGDPAAR